MIELLLHAYRLKDEPRSGWVLRGIDAPESVADHSWGTCLLCMLYGSREDIDVGRALEIAVVHDLAEAVTGDLVARVDERLRSVSPEAKAALEARAMAELVGGLDDDLLMRRWREYEERANREAVFVRDMNLLDMCLQALLYERDRRYDPAAERDAFPDFEGMGEFFASARERLATDTGRQLFRDVEEAYLAERLGDEA